MKSILNFFKNNLKTLIMSVVFAIIIWFAVSIQLFPNVHDHIDGIVVTAEPTSYMQRENLQITDYRQDVSVQILGKRYVIGTLTAEDFSAALDLSGITSPGTHTVDVIVNPIQPNSDYEIISGNLTASVEIERIISKEIALEVNTNYITVSDGLQIQTDDIALSSSSVLISGEEALVNSVAKAVIEPLYEGALTETSKIRGVVAIYDADGTKIETDELEYQSDNYTVTVPVYRVKTLPLNVSITYPQNFNTYSIQYSIFPKEITIAAPANDISIENLERIDVGEIDLTDITSRDLQNSIRLPISLAEGYKNLSGIGIAQVTFENIDSYGRLGIPVSTENFTILNGDPSYDYSFVTSQIDVTAVGPSDVIKSLSSDDILGTVNLLGTQAELGVKNVTVSIRLSGQNNTAWITGDYRIDIMVKKKLPEEEEIE
ncbi:MAG: hypothetical protein NC394_04920 [Bacteroides sp.]|nr:hypothetical protein [Bacteroides sp.]